MTKCVACANPIPSGARKCATCGSYQSIRRYLDISNVTIALMIAFLGLLTALPSTIVGLNNTFRETLAPDRFVRIVKIRENFASVYIRNNSKSDMLISNLGCIVYFAKNSLQPIRIAMRELFEGGASLVPQLQNDDVINPIIIAYKIEPRLLQPGEASIFEFDYMASVIAYPRESNGQNVDSFCGLDWGSNLPLSELTAIPLEITAYADFPLREFIEVVEILPSANTSADEIVDLLVGYDGSETLDQVFKFD